MDIAPGLLGISLQEIVVLLMILLPALLVVAAVIRVARSIGRRQREAAAALDASHRDLAEQLRTISGRLETIERRLGDIPE